jgi:Flp pilus assembly protein TadG
MKTMMNINEETGASAVEFAIVLPLLVLLLFGTIEFGLLLYNQQVITNASREGARAGIVAHSPRASDGDISAVVTGYCGGNLVTFGAPNVPVINCARTGNNFQDDLTVQVTYNYDFLVLSNLGFGQRVLSAQTVMKME